MTPAPAAAPTFDIQRVVAGDYCIGCGACAAGQPTGIRLSRTENGLYRPEIDPDADLTPADRVCPFSSASKNEDELAQSLFPDAPHQSDTIGRYRNIWAGHVTETPYRANGSSGGMGSWLLAEALQQGLVDHVIHVRAAEGGALFAYAISSDLAGVRSGAKSRYYPIELSKVIGQVRATPGRYAFIGIPCMLKAIRNVCAEDAVVAARITFFVGLFCGHMKTADFAASLAWQLGIAPNTLAAVDFRRKLEGRSASSYGFSATSTTGEHAEAPMAGLFGREWGLGFFKPNACEFCDDVVGELADISIGDAWLPKYVNDAQGTNVVIARTVRASALIAAAKDSGRLTLEPLSAKDAYESQAGGFRYRREGLSLRLWLKDKARIWRPKKRVAPRWSHISLIRRRIYQARAEISALSHTAFARAKQQNNFAVFPAQMSASIEKYRKWQRAEYYLNRIKTKLHLS